MPHGRGADRSKLAALPGVVGLDFNLMQRTLAVRHELPSLTPVEQALKAIGMQAVRMDKASDEQTTKLVIAKMDCPTEEALIRNKLATVAGVTNLDFNLMQRTCPCAMLLHPAGSIGRAEISELRGASAQCGGSQRLAGDIDSRIYQLGPLGISLAAALAAEAVYWFHNGNHWSVVVLALVAIFAGGLSTYKKGWIALRTATST